MNISEWWEKGWQLESERAPSVVARTCAKMRDELVLDARRERLMQFQAGMVEVKIHGAGPRAGGV
jgi:hypothetical protein